MTNKIAFSGPSGLGKSTLCKFVNQEFNIPWLSTSAGDILPQATKDDLKAAFGYEGTGHRDVINLSSKDPWFGLAFQQAVLRARTNQIVNSSEFVLDRCPIDNVAYLLSQVGHNMAEPAIKEFIQEAQLAYHELSHVIILKYSNDIPFIEDNGSRVPNRYFQQYISDVFMGVYYRYFASIVGPRVIVIDYWNLPERMSTVRAFIQASEPELEFIQHG